MEVTPSRAPGPIACRPGYKTSAVDRRARGKAKPKVKYALPGDIAADIRKAFIALRTCARDGAHAHEGGRAYDRKRYEEALRLGRIVADAVPGVARYAKVILCRRLPRRALEHGEDSLACTFHHYGRRTPCRRHGL